MARFLTAVASLASLASAQMYGLSAAGELIRQFPNGSCVVLSPPLPDDIDTQQLATIDDAGGIFAAVAYNTSSMAASLVGWHVSNGSIAYNSPLPFVEAAFIGVGQCVAFDSSTGRVVALGQLVSGGPHVVGLFNPVDGRFTQIAALPAAYIMVLGGSCAYHPPTRSFVFQLSVNASSISVFVMNVSSGVYQQVPEDFTNGRDIESMDYDAVTGDIVGVAVEVVNAQLVRTLVTLDVQRFTYKVVGAVTDFTIEAGGIAAVDATSRVLYWVGLPTNSSSGPNGPFYLIGLSLKDASVASSAVLCGAETTCPTSLEFYNPAGFE